MAGRMVIVGGVAAGASAATKARRVNEEIEIIDIRCSDDLRKAWQPFIHSTHYQTHGSFPRVSFGSQVLELVQPTKEGGVTDGRRGS